MKKTGRHLGWGSEFRPWVQILCLLLAEWSWAGCLDWISVSPPWNRPMIVRPSLGCWTEEESTFLVLEWYLSMVRVHKLVKWFKFVISREIKWRSDILTWYICNHNSYFFLKPHRLNSTLSWYVDPSFILLSGLWTQRTLFLLNERKGRYTKPTH